MEGADLASMGVENESLELTVKQVAARACVTEQAVRKALAEGRLRGSRPQGRQWRVPASEAQEWQSRMRSRPLSGDRPLSLLGEGGGAGAAQGGRIQELELQLSQLEAERDAYRDLLDSLVHRIGQRSLQGIA